jgi:phospholipase/carboxylesterase
MTTALPRRAGPRPRTRKGLPHQQLDQQPPDETIRAQLSARVLALAGVAEAPSGISVPGARALILRDATTGPPGAFMVGREFAHLHPPPDQSLHLTLPERRAREAIRAGWAEFHPLVEAGRLPPTLVMVYAPRDDAELEVVEGLVRESYHFALGQALSAGPE